MTCINTDAMRAKWRGQMDVLQLLRAYDALREEHVRTLARAIRAEERLRQIRIAADGGQNDGSGSIAATPAGG